MGEVLASTQNEIFEKLFQLLELQKIIVPAASGNHSSNFEKSSMRNAPASMENNIFEKSLVPASTASGNHSFSSFRKT